MAYIDGPMIDKVLIHGVLHPIADSRIEGTNFAYVQIAGDVVVDTPLTAEQLEHITPAVLSEDGAVFNIPALGTILIPKDVVIQDPAPAEDYKVVYTSSPLEGKVYNLEVTIDHTTSEPKEAVVVEGEVATPPVNIAKTDLEAIKATTPDPTSHIIISDEAKALGQDAVDKKANIIVETDADGQPIDVYHAVESPEPDKYYRYIDPQNHCIDIYFTKDAAGVVTVDGLLFPDQENIYVEKAKEYMEISTTQSSVIYKSVQPVMVEEHVLGFEEVEEATQTQGTAGIIHYPKSVLFTSPAAFTLALDGQEGYARPADAKIEISTDGLTWEESDATAMVADMNTELGKYALFIRCNDYLVSDTLTSWVRFTVSTGSNITVRGILNSLWGGKPVRDRVCTGLFKYMYQLVDASELLVPADEAKVDSYSGMFSGCTALVNAPQLPATTVGASAYSGMFNGCAALTKAPALPATTLGTSCYSGMFKSCSGLKTAPALPALTAANKCYYSMFEGCTALESAPTVLPATTLDGFCYMYMFKGCTSLVHAPALPAMDIKGSSYANMFEDCTALVNAPALPATTLDATGQNYQSMFLGCTSLAKAPELPATTLAQQCYYEMFKGCTALTEPVFFPEIADGGMKQYAMQSMFENCTGIKWATAGKEYKIAVGGGATGDGNTQKMFLGNSGNLPETTGTPKINTVYYLKQGSSVQLGGLIFSAPTEFKMKVTRDPGASMKYCTNGKDWNPVVVNTEITSEEITTNTNATAHYIMFKDGKNVCTTEESSPFTFTAGSTNITVSGKLVEFVDITLEKYAQWLLKYQNKIIDVSGIEMPTALTKKCYYRMFAECANLKTFPSLPATTLAESCYKEMFKDCVSLNATPPALPATTLGVECYYGMFNNTKITQAPTLPATVMKNDCYRSMFANTKLTTPPALPAMSLANRCYSEMFNGVKTFTSVPVLPATTLASNCYDKMFMGCNLTTLPELPATTLASGCYYSMFSSNYDLITIPSNYLSHVSIVEDQAYGYMFSSCDQLTTPCDLPATTVYNSGYENMFGGCSSLTSLPRIGATSMQGTCCRWMFAGCEKIHISTTPGGTEFRVPTTGTMTEVYDDTFEEMFDGFTFSPDTTYYYTVS